jgi:hypothetical protein
MKLAPRFAIFEAAFGVTRFEYRTDTRLRRKGCVRDLLRSR